MNRKYVTDILLQNAHNVQLHCKDRQSLIRQQHKNVLICVQVDILTKHFNMIFHQIYLWTTAQAYFLFYCMEGGGEIWVTDSIKHFLTVITVGI